jgi:transposase
MAMGKRKSHQQPPLFIVAADLPQTPAHPFYRKLNQVLAGDGFDAFVEKRCQKFYHQTMGRPSLVPGRYFRLLLIGYFEGIDSERGIAWRCADSSSVRSFVGYALDEAAADHSTISRTRRLIDLETHHEVFWWVLKLLAKHELIEGKTVGVDATTLEANAAMRSIVRRDTQESYEEFLTRLAKASGIETPTREDLARIDKGRKNKASNDDWEHPHDPDAKITKMKDGTTHLAHKAEHAVDMKTGAVLGVTLQGADQGDTTTLLPTIIEATQNLRDLSDEQQTEGKLHENGMGEVVADKGYHSNGTMSDLAEMHIRSYVSEPDRGRRDWEGKAQQQAAVYANRRRIRGHRGRRLMRRRGELVERTFAHAYETGGMRRLHLRHRDNIAKRLLVHVGGFNLGLVMRKLTGVGKPRRLQGLLASLLGLILGLWNVLATLWRKWASSSSSSSSSARIALPPRLPLAA